MEVCEIDLMGDKYTWQPRVKGGIRMRHTRPEWSASRGARANQNAGRDKRSCHWPDSLRRTITLHLPALRAGDSWRTYLYLEHFGIRVDFTVLFAVCVCSFVP